MSAAAAAAATAAIHDSATVGFHNATAYDAHRPSYPPQAVDQLLTNVGVDGSRGARVVDLAAGTGKMTELLAARPEEFDVVAVEPHAEMRATLEAKKLPRVEIQAGTADSIPGVADGSVDAVVVAQEEALAEIRRILKPDGRLAMIWNIEDYNKPPAWTAASNYEQKLNELILSISRDGQPRFRDYKWKDVFDTQTGLFSTPIGEDGIEWTIWLSHQALWERVQTLSHVALLRGADADDFKEKFDDLAKAGDGQRNDKGEVAIHGKTVLAWTTRL
ncbi:tRNA G46 methylase TrmB [Geosmithia morbida]|uniref:tRNA G46 methylase TrmB n=1 Tax=Geosmithia morbida TaxID=1094350 RepID=A0A9P4YYJ3_9HYPO|nr:tRNA G46 methylase TrmB [Geosmithia morbida]KAF4124033.1 tRNA G46 methylase TrmB [Geosmithia morbida]